MAYKIAFCNFKGGTGKTTSAINVAYELSLRKNKVLLLDMDPQGNATQNMGCNSEGKVNIVDMLMSKVDVNNVIVKTPFKNIDIITSNTSLQDVAHAMGSASGGGGLFLVKAMENLKKQYDFIIIDCSPSPNIINVNALAYADFVMVPMKTDINSINGFADLSQKIKEIKERYNDKIKIAGIFLTVFEKRTALDKEIFKQCADMFGNMFIPEVIDKCVEIREAPVAQVPVQVYKKSGKGSKCYSKLTEKMLERLGDL